MLNPKLFDEITSKLAALAAKSPAKDLEKNMRELLTSKLARLDLVTRQEFELQSEALAKARSQLAALEARIAELENQRPQN